jgi:hypothetical protein
MGKRKSFLRRVPMKDLKDEMDRRVALKLARDKLANAEQALKDPNTWKGAIAPGSYDWWIREFKRSRDQAKQFIKANS